MKGSFLYVSLYVIATGMLIQALLAGMFLSVSSEARMTHIIVGAVLPYLGIFPTVSAWRRANQGEVSRWVAVGTTVLLVGLWAQEALGHMPWPATTVIHVPLGVLLFALAFHLGYTAHRAATERNARTGTDG